VTYRRLLLLAAVAWMIALAGCKDEPTAEPAPTNSAGERESVPTGENRSLLEAAYAGDLAGATRALDGGADANASGPEARTALMLAAFEGRTAVAELLLARGARVDDRDSIGRTALMYASTGPFPETVELLLTSGADPNAVDHGERFTPLMFAAGEGLVDILRLLLSSGADPSLEDVDGDRAVDFARLNGHQAAVELLEAHR
jgi:ankyrin repeat protein